MHPIWRIFFVLFSIFILPQAKSQGSKLSDPKEIIRISQDKLQGESVYAEIKMTIIRPSWQREMSLKSWGQGQEFSLIVVTEPARDKGVAFLKRDKEMWNWQPSIDRVIKLPPSMMSQSWMGSDFTNDDLIDHSSLVDDFTHILEGTEVIQELDCYKIRLKALEETAVVWDEIIMWVDSDEFMQLKVEFYDEDGFLVSTMLGKDPKVWGGKLLPSILEVVPADEPGNKTRVEYLSFEFDIEIQNRFFSVQNLKRVR